MRGHMTSHTLRGRNRRRRKPDNMNEEEEERIDHLLHGPDDNNSCLDRLRRRGHGYGCRGDGHGDGLALLVTGLRHAGGGCCHGDHAGGGGLRRGRGRLLRQRRGGRRGSGRGEGEVQQRQRHRLLLGGVVLVAGGAVLHPDAGVNRLVAPQVVAVLELLVAGGADVGGAARLREGLHCRDATAQKTLILEEPAFGAFAQRSINKLITHPITSKGNFCSHIIKLNVLFLNSSAASKRDQSGKVFPL